MRALSWLLFLLVSASAVIHSSADGDSRLPGDRGPPRRAHERVHERRQREAGRRRPSIGTNHVPPARNARNGPGRRNHGMQGPNGLKSHEPPTDENYFIVDFVTTAGNFSLEVNPSWSPLGADHFLQMARDGYYNNQKVFRVIPNFLVQFGYNGDPAETARRMKQPIKDDPFRVSNRRGYVAFAGNAQDSRRTNIFINLADNFFIDHRDVWATPFGRINSDGMRIVERFYSGYSQRPQEQQPDQGKLGQYGNAYLSDMFPELSEIISVAVTAARLDVHSEL